MDPAQKAIGGVEADAVRSSGNLRQQITGQLTGVQSTLDQMLVDQPRRRILRQNKEGK